MATNKNNTPSGNFHPKSNGRVKPTGKRIGKSKPAKAYNQLNRRIK